MAVIRKDFFVVKFPASFQDYHKRFQNCLEIDVEFYKGLQSYKFYPNLQFKDSDIRANNQYF